MRCGRDRRAPTSQGGERDRVGTARHQAVGGGTVLEVETSDDPGEAYEVEVRKADGTEVDVSLDKNLKVVRQEADDRTTTGTTTRGPRRPGAERRRARGPCSRRWVPRSRAARSLGVEAEDDGGEAYEVEVRAADGTEWDLELDAAFKVVRKTADD